MDVRKRANLLEQLDEIFEGDINTSTGAFESDWDSLRLLDTISVLDEEFGLTPSTERLRECQSIESIISMIEELSSSGAVSAA